MDSLDIQLTLRHEPGRAKWWNDLCRNDPPPFLGPLVTIKEAMEALNRSRSYVCARIDDGRLNTWKDPVSRRVWILKEDVDRLVGDNAAPESAAESRRATRPQPTKTNPQSQIDNPQSEDLDAIGGWVAPEPRGAAGYLEDQEKLREDKYQKQVRETEEWYVAELAKLEGRDPEEAARQLRLDRGWIQPEPTAEPDSVTTRLPLPTREGVRAVGAVRPVSWSNPRTIPPGIPTPCLDPNDQSAIPNPQFKIQNRPARPQSPDRPIDT